MKNIHEPISYLTKEEYSIYKEKMEFIDYVVKYYCHNEDWLNNYSYFFDDKLTYKMVYESFFFGFYNQYTGFCGDTIDRERMRDYMLMKYMNKDQKDCEYDLSYMKII